MSDCAICFEPTFICSIGLHCGHSFHSTCLAGWVQQSNTCPLCRTEIRASKCLQYSLYEAKVLSNKNKFEESFQIIKHLKNQKSQIMRKISKKIENEKKVALKKELTNLTSSNFDLEIKIALNEIINCALRYCLTIYKLHGEEAIKIASLAIEMEPYWAEPRTFRANLLLKSKRFSESLNDIKQVLRLKPRNKTALMIRSSIQYQRSNQRRKRHAI